jgi:hypothetical protein
MFSFAMNTRVTAVYNIPKFAGKSPCRVTARGIFSIHF